MWYMVFAKQQNPVHHKKKNSWSCTRVGRVKADRIPAPDQKEHRSEPSCPNFSSNRSAKLVVKFWSYMFWFFHDFSYVLYVKTISCSFCHLEPGPSTCVCCIASASSRGWGSEIYPPNVLRFSRSCDLLRCPIMFLRRCFRSIVCFPIFLDPSLFLFSICSHVFVAFYLYMHI